MTAATLISFRETLEASLLIGVVLAFLQREGENRAIRFAWLGVLAGITVSILTAYILTAISVVLTEAMEEIYEGLLMLSAAGILAWVTAWLGGNGRSMQNAVEKNVRQHIQQGAMIGIFFLCFSAAAREGMEMAIFLQATFFGLEKNVTAFFGVLLGISIALSLTLAIFRGLRGVPLKQFFRISSLLLLCIGFGLAVRGIGELEQAHVFNNLPIILWNTSNVLKEDSFFGHMAKTLVGYEEQPTVLQVITGIMYLIIVSLMTARIHKHATARSSV